MFRRVIAGLILGPALLIGSFAWWGFLALRTVFDEDRTATIAEELLDNEHVVGQIGDNIGRALEAAMPDSIELTDEQVAAGVDIILTDPVVRDLIVDAFATTHRAFLGLADAPAEIDIGPALESSKERIGVFAPTIAAELPDTFVVELPTERIPDASPVIGFLERTVPLLAGISIVMALMAFLTTSDRSRVLGKAARWAIGTTAFYLILGLGVPYLLRWLVPDQAEILAAFLTAVLRAALLPSIVLGVIGAGLLLLSMFWPDPGRDRSRRRSARPKPAPAPTPAAPRPRPAPAPRPSPAPRPRPAPSDSTTALPARPAAEPMAIPAPPPVVTPDPAPPASPASPAPPVPRHRPTLPTRAKPPESVDLPSWTGDPPGGADPGSPARPPGPPADRPAWLPPTWVEGHGWVMDPDDPQEPPNNARFVEGVGWVVPGPPPD